MAENKITLNQLIHPGKWTCKCNSSGKIISVQYSDTFRKILGYSNETEFENSRNQWLKSIHPDDKERALQIEANAFSKHPEGLDLDSEYRLKTKSGYRWFHDFAHIKRNIDGIPESAEGILFDIDDQKRNTEKLKNALNENRKQSKLLKQALNNIDEHFSILVSMSDIYYSMHLIDLENDTVKEFSARDEVKEIVNKKHGAAEMMHQIISSTTVEEFKPKALDFTNLLTLADRMENKRIVTGEFIGTRIGWFHAQFIAIDINKNNKPTKVIFTTRSIDEEKKKENELIKKSRTDELTGFQNRRSYEDAVADHNNIPTENDFVLISLDVNELKNTNDTFGHKAGDELLLGACDCMRKCFGNYGTLYRIGGDEFVAVIFVKEKKLQKLLKEFDETIESWKGETVEKLSISYGYVMKSENENRTIREINILADKRMYENKSLYYQKSGKDRRGQKEPHIALCLLYNKILKINITNDSYQIIDMDFEEKNESFGYSEKISLWLKQFGELGFVHHDDLDDYLKKTDLKYISDFFKNGNTILRIFYKRKYNNEKEYKNSMMEIIPSKDYSHENQNLYLYVKEID